MTFGTHDSRNGHYPTVQARKPPELITTDRLAVRPVEAAKALGIGQRKLWELTKAGVIPHIKLGTCTLYPVDELRAWLRASTTRRGLPNDLA